MRDKPVLRDKKESLWRALGDVTTAGVTLKNPILTASGTAGHGAELAPYFALSSLGAVVVKSLYPTSWPGNPAPRVHNTPSGMLNAVGLQGPGVDAWVKQDLVSLRAVDATVVASIWGRTIDDYATAARQLVASHASLVAVEVNLSCPNLEGRAGIFAHDADLSAQVVRVVVDELGACGVPSLGETQPKHRSCFAGCRSCRKGRSNCGDSHQHIVGNATRYLYSQGQFRKWRWWIIRKGNSSSCGAHDI